MNGPGMTGSARESKSPGAMGKGLALLLLMFLCSAAPVSAETGHLGLSCCAPCPAAHYKLIDLGAAGLSQPQLTRLEPLYSLAPLVNNLGQVAFNRADGAYIRDPQQGEYALGMKDIKVYTHGINNNGEVLVSIERQHNEIEWMAWTRKTTLNCAPCGTKRHIANLHKKIPAFFCALNDCGTAAGYKEVSGVLRPLIWTPCEGLHPLGYCDCYDIEGYPRGLNNQGTVAGFYEEANDSPPFVWSSCKGLDILRNYRQQIGPVGWVELADMVLTQDNVVYGTYIVKYVSKKSSPANLNRYFMYRWAPYEGTFDTLNVEDFRIAAVNNSNTLAGTYKGYAAIRREGQQPIELSSLIGEEAKDWELIEATDINDIGQVVGYGRYQGSLHLFLLEPTL